MSRVRTRRIGRMTDMDENFEIVVDRLEDTVVIHLSGEITAFSDDAIMKSYRSLELTSAPKLVINFDGTEYINSAGIATLVGIVMDMEKRRGTLIFAGLAPHYQRVVEIVGIKEYIRLSSTVEEALGVT